MVGLDRALRCRTGTRRPCGTGGLPLSPFRALDAPSRGRAGSDGSRSRKPIDELVAVLADPLIQLRVRRLRTERDPDSAQGAVGPGLEHTGPELTVEIEGERRRHRLSRYAEADLVTPDSPSRERRTPVGIARTSYRAVRFAHQELTGRLYSSAPGQRQVLSPQLQVGLDQRLGGGVLAGERLFITLDR